MISSPTQIEEERAVYADVTLYMELPVECFNRSQASPDVMV